MGLMVVLLQAVLTVPAASSVSLEPLGNRLMAWASSFLEILLAVKFLLDLLSLSKNWSVCQCVLFFFTNQNY